MANDRDCENCIHKVNGACKVWECKFEPKRGMTDDVISRQAVLDSIHANCVYENEYNLTAKHIEDAVKQLPPVNLQKPICPSAGIDCEDCPAYEDAISRYQKIKQMLYEFKEMPFAPCFMKGHICAVHEILNEVIDPSASSSQKPKSECEHDHEILKAHSDGANAVLAIIRAEIDEEYDRVHPYDISCAEGLEMALNIVDKFIAEGSDEE